MSAGSEPSVAGAAPFPRRSRSVALWWLGPAFLLVVAAVLFQGPVKDADLWWHMAYGRDMWSAGSPVPDHTVYSWTPTQGERIYCAWLGQLVLYGTYRAGGLPALFALRYLAMLPVLLVPWCMAVRLRLHRHPVTYLVLTMALLMCASADFLKPSLFSVVFMAAAVGVWVRLQLGGARAWAWCYAFPVLMVLWVNTHGGWIFGAFFLLLVGVGACMNALYSPGAAWPLSVRRHLFAALVAAAGATCLSPYGLRYPIYLVHSLTTARVGELRTVRDYDSIFRSTQQGFHYVELWVAALVVLLVLWSVRRRWTRVDWTLILANLAFLGLFAYMVRLTYFWSPLFAVSALLLLREGRPWVRRRVGWSRRRCLIVAVLPAMAAGFLGVRACVDEVVRPPLGQFAGFGISYINPVAEADFLAEHLPEGRLGNDYNAGGYLLWRLAPARKVFIDPRYFPYRGWYEQYRALETTRGIEELLDTHPADLWCIVLPLRATVAWFHRSPDWRPVFYGPSAAVFVRRDGPYGEMPLRHAGAVGRVRNRLQAFLVVEAALRFGDLAGADEALGALERIPVFGVKDRWGPEARALVAGRRLFEDGRYEEALGRLEEGPDAWFAPDLRTGLQLDCFHQGTARAWQAGDAEDAQRWAARGADAFPENPVLLYNAAALTWLVQRRQAEGTAPVGNVHLTRFLALAETRRVHPRCLQVANELRTGRFRGARLPLVMPPDTQTPPADGKEDGP